MRRGVAAIVAMAAFVAVLGGCGGDDDPITTISTEAETTETAATSAEDFIVSADARCAEANSALAGLEDDSSSATVSQRLGILQEVLTGIQGLGTPEDPDGSLADYVRALRSQVDLLGEQQDAAAAGDTATADSLALEIDAAESDALTAGEAYGFEDCGQPPSASTGGTTTTSPGSATPVGPVTTTPAPTTPVEPAPVPEPTPPAGGTDTGGEVPTPEPEPEPEPAPGGGSGGFSP